MNLVDFRPYLRVVHKTGIRLELFMSLKRIDSMLMGMRGFVRGGLLSVAACALSAGAFDIQTDGQAVCFQRDGRTYIRYERGNDVVRHVGVPEQVLP